MLVPKLILLPVIVATAVLADGQAIVDAISAIQNATLDLTSTVASWDGGLLSAIPIVVDSTTLLGTIHKGTVVAKQSANLTDVEAFTVGVSVVTLVTDVNSSISTIIAAKPEFDRALLTPVVLLNLESEKAASSAFSDAIVEKLPAAYVSLGETLAGEITTAFDNAIDVFSGGIL